MNRTEIVPRAAGRLALCAALLLAVACKGGGPPGGGPPGGGPPGKPGAMGGPAMAFAVETAPVAAEAVAFTTSAVGTLDAFEKVLVTARVAGVVDTVRFREGDTVKAGQILADIETDRYALAVRSARAQLDRARAGAADAEAGLARREAAEKQNPGLVRGEELEGYRSKLDAARADVRLAEVAVDRALVDQRDAQVRAPVGGVIQTRDVRTGQYAQPGALMATLLRRDPLLLRFQLAEPDAVSLKPGDEVSFTLAGGARHTARVTHVAAAADATSRMVPVVAEVAEAAADGAAAGAPESLRPGAFAQVSVPLGGTRQAPTIPQSAVRPSDRGFLIYVADGDKARERVLTLGQRTADGRVEVKDGLKVGELLIVRGGEALRDGADIRFPGAPQKAQPLEPGAPASSPASAGNPK